MITCILLLLVVNFVLLLCIAYWKGRLDELNRGRR
jgi:hypothetical protein